MSVLNPFNSSINVEVATVKCNIRTMHFVNLFLFQNSENFSNRVCHLLLTTKQNNELWFDVVFHKKMFKRMKYKINFCTAGIEEWHNFTVGKVCSNPIAIPNSNGSAVWKKRGSERRGKMSWRPRATMLLGFPFCYRSCIVCHIFRRRRVSWRKRKYLSFYI